MLKNQGFHVATGIQILGRTAIGDLRQPAIVDKDSSLSSRDVAQAIGDNIGVMDPLDILIQEQETYSPPRELLPKQVSETKRKGRHFPACGKNDEGGTTAKNLVELTASGPRNLHVRSRNTFAEKHASFYGVRIR